MWREKSASALDNIHILKEGIRVSDKFQLRLVVAEGVYLFLDAEISGRADVWRSVECRDDVAFILVAEDTDIEIYLHF